jgi:hypothetical protein
MRSKIRVVSLWAGGLAALAVAAFLLFAFTRQGTLGLAQWQPSWRSNFILIAALGALPIVLAAAGALVIRDGSRKPAAVFAWMATVLAALAIAAGAALFGYVLTKSRASGGPVPALSLVDPSAGIAGADGKVRISISSDPHWGADAADSGSRSSVLRSVALAKPRRDALFILGDNVERGMDDAPWRAEIADLAATLGGIPARPIMGNHDAVIDGEYHFKRYFMPASMKTDSGSPYYYSMKAGPATIIVLNLLWGAESFGAAQRAWLERALAAQPAGRQVVVLSHCFYYASGYVDGETGMPWFDHAGTIAEVAPILERHKVALAVSGHNHYMELLRKGGVTYAIVGAMGGALDPKPTHVSPESLWMAQGRYGRLDLDIDESGIAMTFRARDGAALREEFLPAAR